MDCEGVTGVLNFTCPVEFPGSSCLWWEAASSSWSSTGCTYWKTDSVRGVAYCNCTHLTTFASDQVTQVQSDASSITGTAAHLQNLSGEDVAKSMWILGCLALFYVAGSILFLYSDWGKLRDWSEECLTEKNFKRYKRFTAKMFPEEPGRLVGVDAATMSHVGSQSHAGGLQSTVHSGNNGKMLIFRQELRIQAMSSDAFKVKEHAAPGAPWERIGDPLDVDEKVAEYEAKIKEREGVASSYVAVLLEHHHVSTCIPNGAVVVYTAFF